jgi:aspartate aminotransferase
MTSFAHRISNIKPEGAYEVLAQAQELERQGHDIIHLEIGQPDFQTFDAICESGKRAIDEGHTRYTPSAGIRELREAIAQRISATKGPCSPNEVVVGPGAKPGILFPILALVNPGDEVLYPDPGFPSYRADIELAGGIPIAAPLIEGRNFSFDLDFLADRMGDKTKLLIINSPSNPTGGTIPREDLETIAKLAIERDVWVMTDEIYGDLVYDNQTAPSFYSIEEARHRTILVALDKCRDAVNAQRAVYQERRDRIVDGLNSLPGVACVRPSGAFYAFPNITGLGIPSAELARRLLNEAGVACLSGTDFGRYGEGYLRFSYAASLEAIDQAIARIRRFIATGPVQRR